LDVTSTFGNLGLWALGCFGTS